ncbi:hypothetical protein [Streptomyces sp. NPDC059247]|uniref:hypothetical protein n=1 Tax=Streptomyces sp. NPDC059247 TaxID=3346790 RepID=UPI0036ACEDDB
MATLVGVVILALALPAWAGITCVGLVRARRENGGLPRSPRRPWSPARKSAWLAVLAFGGGGALHLYGMSYLPFLFPEDACWFGAGVKAYPDSSGTLPVSLVCRGVEIVPWWVNPGLLALAVTGTTATAVSVTSAVRGGRRARRVSDQKTVPGT